MLDLNFKKYMGIENVIYLHPLPGATVKHVDMFLQVAASHVLLLGKFSRAASDASAARLQSAASAALEDNLSIIRDHYQRMGKKVKVIDDDTAVIDPQSINIIRIPLPPVSRPLASSVEQLLRDYMRAEKDYEEHSTLLRLISRFQKQVENLESQNKGLIELEREASNNHIAADHDLELLASVKYSGADIEKIITRYAVLSGEFSSQREIIINSGSHLSLMLDRLLKSTKKSMDDHEPIPVPDLQMLTAATGELVQAARETLQNMQGDINKDKSLQKSSSFRMTRSALELQSIATHFQYGTDLYRTYLNLLPIRTASSFVLALPTYRDPSLKLEEESAVKRIVYVYRQLYGEINVVSVPSDAFIKELGSIHCLTKVLPIAVDLLVSERNQAIQETQP